jgi:hypothetical protein
METPDRQLLFALEKYPEKVEIVPVGELMLESARKNDRRPAWVKLALPDEVVKALRGRQPDREQVFLVRIPHEVSERAGSRIVLPGEVR